MTPAPGTRHQEIVANFGALLHAHARAHGLGKVYFAPVDVILSDAPDDTSIVQPDIVFVANDRLEHISARGIEGAPTLVVEVLSPTVDRQRKRELYARHGVTYYWIADGEVRAAEMHRLAGGAYDLLARPVGGAMVAAEPFPGLALTGIWP